MSQSLLLYFAEEALPARRLAEACGLPAAAVESHRFPDDELRLRLPLQPGQALPEQLVLYRSLDRPNEKLVELLLLAGEARRLGVQRLWLVAPYLAYMRQDMAFHPGEVVSQQIIGPFLAGRFDGVITVDPHLHRIASLAEAIPRGVAVSLSGAPMLAELIAEQVEQPLLLGPDAESAQWVGQAAAVHGWPHGVCTKLRSGDRQVQIDHVGPHVERGGADHRELTGRGLGGGVVAVEVNVGGGRAAAEGADGEERDEGQGEAAGHASNTRGEARGRPVGARPYRVLTVARRGPELTGWRRATPATSARATARCASRRCR